MRNAFELKKILLIDDNEIDLLINRKIIEKSLISESIIVKQSASSALEYLKHVEDDENLIPDIIFLDIKMPEMDGFEFLENFDLFNFSITGRTRIVMLSSSIDKDDLLKVKKNKYVVNFLSKPLSLEKIYEMRKTLRFPETINK